MQQSCINALRWRTKHWLEISVLHTAVPGRNRTLFCCVFWPCSKNCSAVFPLRAELICATYTYKDEFQFSSVEIRHYWLYFKANFQVDYIAWQHRFSTPRPIHSCQVTLASSPTFVNTFQVWIWSYITSKWVLVSQLLHCVKSQLHTYYTAWNRNKDAPLVQTALMPPNYGHIMFVFR